VSTESRLLTFFELLKQMAELQRKRDKIAAEMARVAAGEVILLKDTALEDRFQQFNRGVSCSKIFSESTMRLPISGQGKSFRASWVFLRSSCHQEELTALLEHVPSRPEVTEMQPDVRTRQVYYDWLEHCVIHYLQANLARLPGWDVCVECSVHTPTHPVS
jgi:hypothetical protein